MPDRPIIFSAPMVRALLDGRKTQTRRCPFDDTKHGPKPSTVARYYAPGDRLWVREAHVFGHELDDDQRPVGERKIWYRATDSHLTWYDDDTETTLDNPPWRPSIFMPRWASRLTLTVTQVRVQRLQEIKGRDMIAEGVRCQGCHDVGTGDYSACRDGGCFEQRGDFIHLWNSLHGPEAWDANPWVAAISFTVEKRNIDA
jgi:hypothetical protein